MLQAGKVEEAAECFKLARRRRRRNVASLQADAKFERTFIFLLAKCLSISARSCHQ